MDEHVDRALGLLRRELDQVERVAADEVIARVPPDLAKHAIKQFMNKLGSQLWLGFDHAQAFDPRVRPGNETG